MKVAFPLASIIFHVHTDHFLKGVSLTGGIPLVLWVDHLGVIGITGSVLVMEGFISLVKLTGMCPCSVGVALLVKVAGTGLSNGKADISGTGRFELKGMVRMHGRMCPLLFHSLPSASNLKYEGWAQGLIIDLVLLSMESSGNFTQYDSGSLTSWSIKPVFHTFPCISFTNTGCPSLKFHCEIIWSTGADVSSVLT